MKNIQIDILLSTFNGEMYLVQQINSIINQSYANFKLLIRDDGSNDNTLKILKDFVKEDSRIIIIDDDLGNIGLVKSLEKLLNISTADFIMFSDQDDIWISDKIETFINEAVKYDIMTPLLLYSDSYLFFEESNSFKLHLSRNYHPTGLNNLLFKFFVQGASSMINRSLKNSIIPFSTNVYIHDRYIHLMAQLLGTIIFLPKPTMYYRQHNGNLIGATKSFKISSLKLFFKRGFFIEKDRDLIISIYEKKFPNNLLLKAYCVLVDENVSKLKKIRIILRYKISIRVVDFLRMLLFK